MPTTPNFSQPAIFSEVATPTVPDSGYLKVYAKSGALYSIDSAGTEKNYGAAGGGGGITSINGDTTAAQLLTVGTSGTNFAIDSTTTPGTSVFNIPDASATARGLITTGTQTIAGAKRFNNPISGYTDSTDFTAQLYLHNATSTARPSFGLARSKGTEASKTAVANADYIGSFMFSGYDGTAYQTTAMVLGIVDGSVSSLTVPQSLQFITGTTEANRAARLTISSAGAATFSGNVRAVGSSVYAPSYGFGSDNSGFFRSSSSRIFLGLNGNVLYDFNSGNLCINSGSYGVAGGAVDSNNADVMWVRDGAGIWATRNGTNAQAFRLYNTYTSSTSYENLQFKANAGAAYQIGSAVGSAGGTNRDLTFGSWDTAGTFTSSFYTSSTYAGINDSKIFYVGTSSRIEFSALSSLGSPAIRFAWGGGSPACVYGGSNTLGVGINGFTRLLFGTSSTDFTGSPFTISNTAVATGAYTGFTFTGAAHTNQTASTEATMVNWNLAQTVQFATGALTTQRAMRIQAPTYSFVGASTITTASTLSISGAPTAGTNATISFPYALSVESGNSYFGGDCSLFSFGGANGLRVMRANGTSTVPTQVLSGDALSFYSVKGYHNSSAYHNGHAGFWGFYATENYTLSSQGSQFILMTTQNGSNTPTTRLTIGSTGTSTFAGSIIVTQPTSTSGSPTAFTLTDAAHTTMTASTEATSVNFNLSSTKQFATGAISTQRAMRIQAPTYSFVGASTIVTAATLSLDGAPIAGTNATITNSHALLINNPSNSGSIIRINASPGGPNPSQYCTWNGNSAFVSFLDNSADNPGFGVISVGGDYTKVAIGLNVGVPYIGFGPGDAGRDIFITRDSAGILAQRNGTNAQTFRVYGTWTSTTSYERLNVKGVASANFEIGPENGSAGGTLRGLTLGGYSAGSSTITPWLMITNTGNVGIGTTTISARAHVISTTEQLRIGYDASNYYSTTVNSAGSVTFNAVGASSSFSFSDAVTCASSFAVTGASTLTGALIVDDQIYIRSGSLYFDTYGTHNGMRHRRANGTLATPSEVFLNDLLGFWNVVGYHDGGGGAKAFHTNSSAGIYMYASEDFTPTACGANLRLLTTALGSTALAVRVVVNHDGRVAIGGNNTAPSSLLHLISTTEQLRIGYDTGDYFSTTVSSVGLVTFNAVGSDPSFVFSDAVNFSKLVGQASAEITSTPSGTTQTITLDNGNHQTLTLTSSTGNVTVTLTVPSNVSSGTIIVKQHATTPRNITWAVSAGTIKWMGTQPTWSSDAVNAVRIVSWRYDGSVMYLMSTDTAV